MTALRSYLALSPFKISIGYFVFGLVWIPTTDVLLAVLFRSQQMPTLLGLLKGWSFIGLSTLLIYGLSRRYRHQMFATQNRLKTANQQLQVLHRVFRHNIRNDLNVIHGHAEIVSERVGERQSEEHLKVIEETTDRIIEISEKLKAVEGVDPASSADSVVDLVELVTAEIDRVRSERSAVNVTTDLPNRAWIEGDDSIRYAVREVLENAIHHNDKEVCEIDIAVERTVETVRLVVSDNGPGIPDVELESIQSGRETQLVHASGVGLWVVTWVCRLHDGYVRFATKSSAGTTVSFRFRADSTASVLNVESQITERVRAITA